MKEFNLEQAKAGKPICTRDGKKARIICFDRKGTIYPIYALIENKDGKEYLMSYTLEGKYINDIEYGESKSDLMMAQEKHEGWINVGRCNITSTVIYLSEEEAKEEFNLYPNIYIATIKIEWEE